MENSFWGKSKARFNNYFIIYLAKLAFESSVLFLMVLRGNYEASVWLPTWQGKSALWTLVNRGIKKDLGKIIFLAIW